MTGAKVQSFSPSLFPFKLSILEFMNIDEILKNTSAAEHAQFVSDVLSASFGVADGRVDPAKKVSGAARQILRRNAEKLLASACANADEVAAVGTVAVECLAQAVFDKFNEAACEVNNGGAEDQFRYLIVEGGCSAEQVADAMR